MYVHTKRKERSMNVRCLKEDRKDLVKALERRLDVKAKYLGAPDFSYEIGPYKVLKDGTLEFGDDADKEMLSELQMKGFISDPGFKEGVSAIALPIEKMDGITLMNIVFRINSKDELLSKVAGKTGCFKISSTFISELDSIRPKTREEFFEVLESCGGPSINTGISFTKDKVIFGFPYTEDPGLIQAYAVLAEKIQNEAARKKRIRPERIGLTDNEKYSFRNFLVSIGMRGDEYKAERALLLRNLTGHIAFRTKVQMEKALEKSAEARREKKCSEFHVL